MATTTLHSWKMPRVPQNQIYEGQMGCFSVGSDQSVICFEDTISMKNGNLSLRLLLVNGFKKALESRKKSRKLKKSLHNCYLHVGLVQLGVKPLVRQVAEDSILMCLRDARFLDFKKSMLGIVESDLKDGPIHFDCYPNSMIPLSEPNLSRALTVNLMSKASGKTTNGVEPLVLSYRVYCKILSRPQGERALKESPTGKTTMYQAKLRFNSVVSKEVKWDDVEIPQSWLQEKVEEQQTGNLIYTSYCRSFRRAA